MSFSFRDLFSTTLTHEPVIATPAIPYPEPSDLSGEIATDCAHDWQEKARAIAPPRKDMTSLSTDTEAIEKIALGVLTIVYECDKCHQLYRAELLGSDKSELDELLDRAESSGGLYHQRNGITYVIQRYNPQSQSVTIR